MFILLSIFFFFKQKTAYEMRISDWSSDVCSSDLPHRRGYRRRDRGAVALHRVDPRLDREFFEQRDLAPGRKRGDAAVDAADMGQRVDDHRAARTERRRIVEAAPALIAGEAAEAGVEGLAAERHPLGGAGGAAGQHLDRDAGRGL